MECDPLHLLPSTATTTSRTRDRDLTAERPRMSILERQDPDVWQAVQGERRRQQQGLEMIASENYTSPAVMAAQGSCLTNKYAEGYPGRRYYGGCEFVDIAEQLAIERLLKLFGAARANVQPHSGAQ